MQLNILHAQGGPHNTHNKEPSSQNVGIAEDETACFPPSSRSSMPRALSPFCGAIYSIQRCSQVTVTSGCWSAPSSSSGASNHRNGLQGPEGCAVHPSHLISNSESATLAHVRPRAFACAFLLPGLLSAQMSAWVAALLPLRLCCTVTFLGRPSLATRISSQPHLCLLLLPSPFFFSLRHAIFVTYLSVYLEWPPPPGCQCHKARASICFAHHSVPNIYLSHDGYSIAI